MLNAQDALARACWHASASAYVCCPKYDTGGLVHQHHVLCLVAALSCNDGQQVISVELDVV